MNIRQLKLLIEEIVKEEINSDMASSPRDDVPKDLYAKAHPLIRKLMSFIVQKKLDRGQAYWLMVKIAAQKAKKEGFDKIEKYLDPIVNLWYNGNGHPASYASFKRAVQSASQPDNQSLMHKAIAQ